MGRRRPLVPLVLALGTGIGLSETLGLRPDDLEPWLAGALGLALLAAVGVWAQRRSPTGRGATLVLLALVLVLGLVRAAQTRLPAETLWPRATAIPFVRGTIVDYPVQTATRTRFTLAADGLPGRIQVFYAHPHHRPVTLSYGDRLWLRGPLAAPQPWAGFDYPRYLAYRGVWAVLYLRRPDELAVEARGGGRALLRWGQGLRRALFERIERGLPPGRAAAFEALLFGERAALSPEVESDFRRAGVAHVLAASGLHLGILAGGLWLLLRTLGAGVEARYLLVGLAVGVYLLLTGFKVSLARAAVLFGFIALGNVLKARGLVLSVQVDPLQGLAAAGLVLLIQRPQALFEPSFQLSFAATGAILWALPLVEALQARAAPRPGPKASRRARARRALRCWLLGATGISLAAQLGVLPLIARHFHQLYLGALLANLLVVPLVTAILWLGGAWLALGAPALPAPALAWGLGALEALVAGLADVPGLALTTPSWPGWALGLYALGFVLAGGALRRRFSQSASRAPRAAPRRDRRSPPAAD